MSEHTVRVHLAGSVLGQPGETLQILAISAGSGNGWEFSEAVLRESLTLWQGVECFIDHAWNERSLRDLAGICTHPRWKEAQQGICLDLQAIGPGAELLLQTARQMQSSNEILPDVGFSADLLFNAEDSRVSRILKVFSVDLVVHPARGGKFLTTQSTPEEEPMEEVQTNLSTAATPATATEPAQHQQMCERLLQSTLEAARLPEPVSNRLRGQFSGRVFTPN